MKIAINGFGRIGRIFFRLAFGKEDFDILAINDLSDVKNLAYLLKYDSVYGKYEKEIKLEENPPRFIIDGREILIFSEKDPKNLPWKDLGIDIVVEATGIFTDYEKAKSHLDAGAKRVVITAPAKDNITPTFTPGLEPENLAEILSEYKITSNASCTTNAVNPVIYIMMKTIGVKKAILNTIHAYTATQNLVDGIVKGSDWRRGRAASLNIVPSTTGAADATIKVIPEMRDKFDGVSIRVPVVCGSLADITFLTERKTTVEEVNSIFREYSKKKEWDGVVKVIDDEIVSTDILKEPYGALIDLTLTKVVDGDLVKVFSWYDNEWGYCAMLIKHIETLKNFL